MLKIRLQRTGRVHEPTFRLVVTDSRNSTKSGKALEVLGSHDFRKDNTHIDSERVKYWMSKGAQTSDTVHNLLISQKIIDAKKKNVLPKKTVVKKEEPKAEEKPAEVEEKPKEETKTEPEQVDEAASS